MASQESTAPAVEEQEHLQEHSEQPQEALELAPPSPPPSDTEARTPEEHPSSSNDNHPRRPHHLTTTSKPPSFAASTASSSRRAAEASNHNNSMISPAATTTSTSSIRSHSGGDRSGPGSVGSGSGRGWRKSTTVPDDVGPYANSTFASRQRSINGESDTRKNSDGRPAWR